MTGASVKQTDPFLPLPKALCVDDRPIKHDKNPAKPLNHYDKWVWVHIKWWDWGEDRPWEPTYELLAEKAQMSERQVEKSVKRLEVAGWLKVERTTGKINSWEALTSRPDGVPHPQVTKREAIENQLVRRGAHHAPPHTVRQTGAHGAPPGGAHHAPTGEKEENLGEEDTSDPATRDTDDARITNPDNHWPADVLRLTRQLAAAVKANGHHVARKHTKASDRWFDSIDKLIRLDGVAPAEVAETIAWATDPDGWWHPNIRSADKFRSQYSMLRGQMRRAQQHDNAPRPDADGGTWTYVDGMKVPLA